MMKCRMTLRDLRSINEKGIPLDTESLFFQMNLCKCGAVPFFCINDNDMLEISCGFCGNKINRKCFSTEDVAKCIQQWDGANVMFIEVKEETTDGNND